MVPLRRRLGDAPSSGRRRTRPGILGRALRSLAAWSCRLALVLLVAGWWAARFAWRLLTRAVRLVAAWALSHPRLTADGTVIALSTWALWLVFSPYPPSGSEIRFAHDDDGLTCLALNIYHEARGEPLEGKIAVAQVVLNRVDHVRFPDEICAVIKDGGEWPRGFCQFSWWCDGQSDTPRDLKNWEISKALAEDVFWGRTEDKTAGALWYHADYVSPYWGKVFERGPKIGRHIFYNDNKKRILMASSQ